MRARLLPLLLVPSLCLLGGCDLLKPKVSQSKLEDALGEWLKDHELEAQDIHCPGDQPLEKGHTFECTCKVHGTDIPVKVEVIDVEEGTVEWEPKYLTLPRASVEAEIKGKPELADHELQIDCHDPVWVSIPDSEWSCEVVDLADGNKKYTATVTFADAEGTHSMTIDPAS